ncbi:GNAT family N-acetyltransferase [Demequina salsinemoris]|uniref:GNAT family N-acetyltransferase n=1 Tax=Demequina salsinemoris TaxID=577470 RepID=UPI000783C486|nr:GNAT family protein [Demequina salsinemoris]
MTFADTPRLTHELVRLEPLALSHHDDLCEAVSAGDLWRTWYTSIPAPHAMEQEIERRLSLQFEGLMAPWAVVSTESGKALGMTTYMNLDEPNRRLEIGSTWLGKEAHGTGINPAAKLLLLTRAFDELGCVAVEFRTHWHNHQSRAAIARLGAKQDGVLRSHMLLPNGSRRDTVVFSILDYEWPAARNGLLGRLAGRG